jgi:uncharacterized repeat protein (TIGR01451 family)/LPXTG-motif cell wall-anchored protein
MRLTKRSLAVVTVIAWIIVGVAIATPSLAVQGSFDPQFQATPRPTLVPTPVPTQPANKGSAIASQIDLALVVDKAEAEAGDQLQYQLQVDNVLGQEATNVWLTCDLPDQVSVESVSASRGETQRYGQRISFELGQLPASFDSEFFTIVVRVQDDVQPGTALVHRASLTSDQASGAERTVTTQVVGAAPTVAVQSPVASLPTTGSSSIPWWLVVGFFALIVIVALLSTRGRIRPLR